MKLNKYPLFPIALFFGVGIVFQYYLSLPFFLLLFILISLLIPFIIYFIKKHHDEKKSIIFSILTFLIAFSLGAISLFIHQENNHKNHYSKLNFFDKNHIKGTILSELKPNDYYKKYIVDINSFQNQKAIGKVIMYSSNKNLSTFAVGDNISLVVALEPIPKNFNPNQFDYSTYLEKQNVFHQVKVFENDYLILGKNKNFNYYVSWLKDKLVKSFEIHSFSENTKSIVNALLLGQKQDLNHEIVDDYKNTGVIHVLAISGLHIGILYAFFSFLLGFLNQFKNGSTIKTILIICFLWLFAFISGMSASIARSVTMFTFVAIGTYFNRHNSLLHAVASSFILLLIYNPLNIFDVGFQLSYGALVSILVFQPFYSKFYFSKNKIIIYFIDIILVSMAAQIGVLPLMLFYFKQMPTLFLMANFVVIPISTAILILSIITLALNFISDFLAKFIGILIEFLVGLMNDYIHFLSSFKMAVIKNITFNIQMAFVLYLFILFLAYWIYKPNKKRFKLILVSILVFQIIYLISILVSKNNGELILFNSKESTISIYDSNELNIYSNDSLVLNNESLNLYRTDKFNPKTNYYPLENTLFYNNNAILVVDSSGIYSTSIKPKIVILRENTKINLERLIKSINPKIIIADRTNKFYALNRWKATCLKNKIPFHAIAEKGFYRLK